LLKVAALQHKAKSGVQGDESDIEVSVTKKQ
jgi:hypothetical protein